MAKIKDNPKKKSEEKNTQDNKVSRGRPSKDSKIVDAKKDEKVEVKSDKKTTQEVVKEKAKAEVKKDEPTLDETAILIKDIYGDEPVKDYVPFPQSEQKTQTIAILSEFNIDRTRLPLDISLSVDDFASDFTVFTSNPMMIQMVSTIIEKDTKAFNDLSNWVEPRKDKLIALKIKTVGGVSVTKSEPISDNQNGKVVVDSNNINNVINSIPNNNTQPIQNATPNQNQQSVSHGENPLIPRQPTGSYQHNIHSNPVNNNVSPSNPIANHNMGMTENKNIHHEMLNKSNHFADVHKQQNLQYTPEVVAPVSNLQYLQDYSKNIMEIVNSTFQMIHWQYIPIDTLKGILANADKGLGYEVIQITGTDECYINISRGGDKISTEKFKSM
jgi:hypothetical protein